MHHASFGDGLEPLQNDFRTWQGQEGGDSLSVSNVGSLTSLCTVTDGVLACIQLFSAPHKVLVNTVRGSDGVSCAATKGNDIADSLGDGAWLSALR